MINIIVSPYLKIININYKKHLIYAIPIIKQPIQLTYN